LENERWHVVYCGCEEKQFKVSNNVNFANKPISLVGRITEWKGQHIFIEAASKVLRSYPNTQFQIVGSALFGELQYETYIHELVETLHLENNVKFLGFRKDVPDILNDSSMVVHASVIDEPFGQVVIEAMVSGRPVIATKGGAMPEIVTDGVTGLLVEKGDSDAMANAICNILAHPEVGEKMGEAGRRRVLENFTIDRTSRKIEAIYSSVLEQQHTMIVRAQSAAEA
jgi:glycosyltransferase involved in cell wall biosynthesis